MKTSPGTAVPVAPAPARRRPFGALGEGVHDLTSRVRLIRFLVGAELKRTHADTTIGRLWWILDPVLQMFVYWILVAVIFQRKTPDILLFLMSAILPWKWLSTTLAETSSSITSRQSLIRQLQFPKLVLPAAAAGAALVSFAFGLVALAFLYVLYPQRLSLWVLALPLVAAVQFVFSLALGTMLAAANAFFRDVQNVLRHVIRLWMYLTPVLYSLNQLEAQPVAQAVLSLNPMAPIIESYRRILYGTETSVHGMAPEWGPLLVVLGLSFILTGIAIVGFKRAEPSFARILS